MLLYVFYFAAGDSVTTTYAVAAFLRAAAYMLYRVYAIVHPSVRPSVTRVYHRKNG